jgi:dihydropteroate synthase
VEEFGDCIVNDISAGELDPTMVETVAELRLPYVAMHMRGTPTTMQKMTSYSDVVEDVRKYFLRKIEQLREAGIEDIVVDAALSQPAYYDLQGRRHTNPNKGLYIVKGKKVVLK